MRGRRRRSGRLAAAQCVRQRSGRVPGGRPPRGTGPRTTTSSAADGDSSAARRASPHSADTSTWTSPEPWASSMASAYAVRACSACPSWRWISAMPTRPRAARAGPSLRHTATEHSRCQSASSNLAGSRQRLTEVVQRRRLQPRRAAQPGHLRRFAGGEGGLAVPSGGQQNGGLGLERPGCGHGVVRIGREAHCLLEVQVHHRAPAGPRQGQVRDPQRVRLPRCSAISWQRPATRRASSGRPIMTRTWARQASQSTTSMLSDCSSSGHGAYRSSASSAACELSAQVVQARDSGCEPRASQRSRRRPPAGRRLDVPELGSPTIRRASAYVRRSSPAVRKLRRRRCRRD